MKRFCYLLILSAHDDEESSEEEVNTKESENVDMEKEDKPKQQKIKHLLSCYEYLVLSVISGIKKDVSQISGGL